jgi:hypothetical protein
MKGKVEAIHELSLPFLSMAFSQQFQIQNILPILNQRSIISGGVGQVCSSINCALRVFLA